MHQLGAIAVVPERAHPHHLLEGAAAVGLQVDRVGDVPDVDGALGRPVPGDRMVDPGEHVGRGR
jgi:hypothetical protein